MLNTFKNLNFFAILVCLVVILFIVLVQATLFLYCLSNILYYYFKKGAYATINAITSFAGKVAGNVRRLFHSKS